MTQRRGMLTSDQGLYLATKIMADSKHEIIFKIEQLLETNASVEEFRPLVQQLVALAPYSIGSYHEPGLILYRGTNHHRSVPNRIDEIWFPPPEVAPLGRANRKGSPMFYATADPYCVFSEPKVSVGQTIVKSKWSTTKLMMLHDLGYSEKALRQSEARRDLPEHHKTFNSTLRSEDERNIRDYFASAFTESVVAKYGLTAAIAEIFMEGDEICGVLYPAVSKQLSSDNVALQPEFVRSGLQLLEAQVIKVDKVDANGYEGIIICDLVKCEPNGLLNWKFREVNGTKLPPNSHRMMGMRIDDTIRFEQPMVIEIDSIPYAVETGLFLRLSENCRFQICDLQGNILHDVDGITIVFRDR